MEGVYQTKSAAIEKETSHQSWEEKERSNNQAPILQKENDFAAAKFHLYLFL